MSKRGTILSLPHFVFYKRLLPLIILIIFSLFFYFISNRFIKKRLWRNWSGIFLCGSLGLLVLGNCCERETWEAQPFEWGFGWDVEKLLLGSCCRRRWRSVAGLTLMRGRSLAMDDLVNEEEMGHGYWRGRREYGSEMRFWFRGWLF